MKTLLIELLILIVFINSSSAFAEDEIKKNYVSANLVIPTPKEYFEFDFGLGAGMNIGRLTPWGVFELELFDTSEPAKSSDAYDIDQNRVPGMGPTEYYSRAVILNLVAVTDLKSGLIGKLKAGISYRNYRISRPDAETDETDYGLSYGAGIWWNLSGDLYLTMEYTAVDSLLDTAHFGILLIY